MFNQKDAQAKIGKDAILNAYGPDSISKALQDGTKDGIGPFNQGLKEIPEEIVQKKLMEFESIIKNQLNP